MSLLNYFSSSTQSSSTMLPPEQKAQINKNKRLAIEKLNMKKRKKLENVTETKIISNNKLIGYDHIEDLLESSWLAAVGSEFKKNYFLNLKKFLNKEEKSGAKIFPPKNLIFEAFRLCPFSSVRVVIIGQDPYHDNGQAEGLCFSVPVGIKIPSSLRNIYKELTEDIKGFNKPTHGHLVEWARQGVFLLNTGLTVRAHQANSHKKKGWQTFTDAVIKTISDKREGVVFLLWGKHAQQKEKLINSKRHHILTSPHPSGLSAHRGFFGNRHFSQCNDVLTKQGENPISWHISSPANISSEQEDQQDKNERVSIEECELKKRQKLEQVKETKVISSSKLVGYDHIENLLESSWLAAVGDEFKKNYFLNLKTFLNEEERNGEKIFPPKNLIFEAFRLCPFLSVRVVIIGQDPYHDNGQAEGLCFSVPFGIKIPSSLRNIYKELMEDIKGFKKPTHGNLVEWAKQGVFLLNTGLTVRAHQANSHKKKGWQTFTDAVIKTISDKQEGVVFLLWGKHAQQKEKLINSKRHHILISPHPSGLSAHRGFFGNRHFSQCNNLLTKQGKKTISWHIKSKAKTSSSLNFFKKK